MSLSLSKATITVELDDMNMVNSSLTDRHSGKLSIPVYGSAPFSMTIRPRAIGQLGITITAVTGGGLKDIVHKPLYVKVSTVIILLINSFVSHPFLYTPYSLAVSGLK